MYRVIIVTILFLCAVSKSPPLARLLFANICIMETYGHFNKGLHKLSNISTNLGMCDGKGGEQVREGRQMWTVFRAGIVRMSPVCPQDVLQDVATDEFQVVVVDPARPLALQLVVLPRLLLHVVHSFLSTQSVGVDVQEVPPNHLTPHQQRLTRCATHQHQDIT